MRLIILALLVSCLGCTEPAPGVSRTAQLATSFCKCTGDLVALNQKAQSNPDSLDFRNIATEFDRSLACVKALGIKPEEKEQVKQSLLEKCPDIAPHEDLLVELLND